MIKTSLYFFDLLIIKKLLLNAERYAVVIDVGDTSLDGVLFFAAAPFFAIEYLSPGDYAD